MTSRSQEKGKRKKLRPLPQEEWVEVVRGYAGVLPAETRRQALAALDYVCLQSQLRTKLLSLTSALARLSMAPIVQMEVLLAAGGTMHLSTVDDVAGRISDVLAEMAGGAVAIARAEVRGE